MVLCKVAEVFDPETTTDKPECTEDSKLEGQFNEKFMIFFFDGKDGTGMYYPQKDPANFALIKLEKAVDGVTAENVEAAAAGDATIADLKKKAEPDVPTEPT